MKRSIKSILFTLVLSFSLCGLILNNYSVSPTLVAMAEYVIPKRGIPYTRPSIKYREAIVEVEEPALPELEDIPQNSQEREDFKKDLDSFYTLVTRFEKDEQEVNMLYKELLEKWQDDPERKKTLRRAYMDYQVIDLTWGV